MCFLHQLQPKNRSGSTIIEEIAEKIKKRDKRALAKAITLIENRSLESIHLLDLLGPKPNHSSHIIGITGPPGAGKSTLVDKLVQHYLDKNLYVGVIAVDPSSPFSGGAVLGDRIRILDQTMKTKFYMRSMASRGHLGGLSSVTLDVLLLYQHFGFDKIIVETVGAGQSEVEIAELCDTTIVVAVPGLGDSIQNMKAGIMEIANIFVVNKADLPGADQVANQIYAMMHLLTPSIEIPIIKVSATNTTGIDDLVETIELHFTQKKSTSNRQRYRKMIVNRVWAIINPLIEQAADNAISNLQSFETATWESIELLMQQLEQYVKSKNDR